MQGSEHVRTWTISSHPSMTAASGTFTITVKKAGLISTWLYQHLEAGKDALEFGGVAGDFTPADSEAPVLLVAGGIGACGFASAHPSVYPSACRSIHSRVCSFACHHVHFWSFCQLLCCLGGNVVLSSWSQQPATVHRVPVCLSICLSAINM
jgi:predicted ferric reductase